MTFWVHTYGCQMNERDSEAVEALLEALGHRPAADAEEADIVVVNTCTVRGKAEDKAVGKLRLLCSRRRGRPPRLVGAMGCMVQRLGTGLFERVPGLAFALATRRQAALPEFLARAATGERGLLALDGADDRDVAAGHRPGACTAFVTVLLGCNRRCAYCIVPAVRGAEYSRPAAEVIEEVQARAAAGAREITLLGQSVMNYGRSNPVWPEGGRSPGGFTEPFARLVEAVAAVPGVARVRFTSGHPSGCTDELVRAMRDLPAVCPHLHLPVQSGSDRVLGRMRRDYTRASYLGTVARLRAAIPDLALTSDAIVGFPGETLEDFEDTRTLMDAAGFDNAFIFKYSPRPGTPAAALDDDVPESEKMRRNKVLLADQDRRGLTLNQAWVGRIAEVLVEGPSLRNAERWSGRSLQNKIVHFAPTPGLQAGDLVSVRIAEAAPQTLNGEVLAPAGRQDVAQALHDGRTET
jgi:tRNA-2-methylthio-N6-dimethylallyladenosine synthase